MLLVSTFMQEVWIWEHARCTDPWAQEPPFNFSTALKEGLDSVYDFSVVTGMILLMLKYL